jgi:hypothetical protein
VIQTTTGFVLNEVEGVEAFQRSIREEAVHRAQVSTGVTQPGESKHGSMQSIAGYPAPQSECLQDPNGNGNHNHYIQNGLDTGRHGDEVVDQPQRDADHDQRNNDVY